MAQQNETFTLADIVYDVTYTDLCYHFENGNIILYPEVDAETEDEDVEYDMSCVHLYHNNGFCTNVSNLESLKGKKFVWESTYNENDEEAGCLCVQEHELLSSGTIEILDIQNNHITIRWSGLANVYWDETYGADVPFDTTFTAEIPQDVAIHQLDTYKSTKTKIYDNLYLELLDLDAFNHHLKQTSDDTPWNIKLSFKVIYFDKEYLGDISLSFQKNKLIGTTALDADCPVLIRFAGMDYNFKANYQLFFFETY